MSRKEKIKAGIDILKSVILALMASIFGMFSFIVINIKTITILQVILTLFGLLIVTLVFIFLIKILFKLLNDLGDENE